MKQTIVILTLFLFGCSATCIEQDDETCENEQRQTSTNSIEKTNARTIETRSINTVSRKFCVREREEQSYCFD